MALKVKLFFGIIYSEGARLNEAVDMLREKYGDIDFESDDYPFNVTDYYEKEMGANLRRKFFSFSRLIDAEKAGEIKADSRNIERKFCADGGRTVNLDPGYVDFYKIVLPSFKEGGHKIYVGGGVYLDIVLLYDKGWRPFIWTFPDFAGGRYDAALTKIRDIYKKQITDLRG